MKSRVSGSIYKGQLTLTVTGNQVTGRLETHDGSKGEVSGRYDPATGLLFLTRVTGLETTQRYTLRSVGNKFIGQYQNEGRFIDDGTFEFGKITL